MFKVVAPLRILWLLFGCAGFCYNCFKVYPRLVLGLLLMVRVRSTLAVSCSSWRLLFTYCGLFLTVQVSAKVVLRFTLA